jgi:hypothetical protein
LLCCGDGGGGVRTAERGRVFALEVRIQPPVVQDHEAKTVLLEGGALARPGIAVFTGRIIQPVSGVGEAMAQFREQLVSGIVVPIEACLRQAELCPAKPQQAKTRL